jgi:hypothetical protein
VTATTITCSSELMQNYLQTEILTPETGFEAVQKQDGTALLFSIGSDQVFYVTEEVPTDRSGWVRTDLSSQAGHVCTHFAVAQPVTAGADRLHLALVVEGTGSDTLYLSLGNDVSVGTWAAGLTWTAYPYDDPKHPRQQVKIAGVMIAEASDGEYIVVDILRDPTDPNKEISRYYIDVAPGAAHAWQSHDLAVDISAGHYTSCLGRKSGQTVDGVYTVGQIGGSAQCVYQPLYNPYGTASPTILKVGDNLQPDAIAACRNRDNKSDLYAVAGGRLWYFASTEQHSGESAVPLFANDLFHGVQALYASLAGESVVIWGLNGNAQIFYTSCAAGQRADASAWTFPVPILSGVDAVAPCLNPGSGLNEFFAHVGEDKLVKAVKTPGTTMWAFRNITLPPPTTGTPAISHHSYTTRVQVLDEDGQPVSGATVTVRATSVTSVYANYLYRVVGPDPVEVIADAAGVVTLVETVHTLAGTQLTFGSGAAGPVTVNPMDNAIKKSMSLNSVDALNNAQITNPDGTTRKLIPAGTSADKLQQMATANQKLAAVYPGVSPHTAAKPPAYPKGPIALTAAAAADLSASLLGGDAILLEAGDLLCWLIDDARTALVDAIDFVEDTARGIWSFACQIAGDVYHCALDCIEAVAAAAVWLYKVVETAIEDAIKYLSFLFEWSDITRTKEVVHNLVSLCLDYHVAQIGTFRTELDGLIKGAESAINKWAGHSDWSRLGDAADRSPSKSSTPSAGQSAPGSLVSHHFQNNAHNITPLQAIAPPEASSGLADALVHALGQEANAIGTAWDRLEKVAGSLTTTPLADSLKDIVAILVDVGLASAQNVADALLGILSDVAETAVAFLATPIHIPVLSDILNEIGIPDFSLLDIVCWICAVPITVGYKLAKGSAPFPDSPTTTFLVHATDFSTVVSAFTHQAAPAHQIPMRAQFAAVDAAPSPEPLPAADSDSLIPQLPPLVLDIVFHVLHACSGLSALVGCVVDTLEAGSVTDENPFAKPSGALAIMGGITAVAANKLVPKAPLQATSVSGLSTGISIGWLAAKGYFSSTVQIGLNADPGLKCVTVTGSRQLGAIVSAVLSILSLACTCYHFYELAQKPEGAERSLAIIEETSSCTTYAGRAFYAVAVSTKGPPSAAAALGTGVAGLATGGLQLAEAFVGW